MSPKLITPPEAAAKLGVSLRTLRTLSTQPDGPRVIRIGRSVRYSADDLDRWLQNRMEH
ncbi:helix-turn-helix transcriptional regulator [Maricaulis maris]|uniref:helix-turn-helix transcriptional regulator n=1 Tax=Maricaulis maris TaxID=74318 RepID=UPI003A945851